MASYTNIKDILKQFELQIVQQKHYKKDETMSRSDITTAISNAIAGVSQMHIVIASNAGTTPKDVEWTSGSTTVKGTLTAASASKNTFYYVKSNNGTGDAYDEYIALKTGTDTYAWEKIGNTDVDLSNYVKKTTTVNGHALSSNVTVTKSDVGLGNVTNVATTSTITNGNDKDKNITSGAVYSALNASITESSDNGIKLSGKVNAPTITVAIGNIAGGNTSVITGAQVFEYAQPKNADLTAITALTETKGFLKKTAENTWSLDTNTYLTTGIAASTYTGKETAYSSSSAGVALGGTSGSPTIKVTGGSIANNNTSVVTGGTVYNYAQPKDDTLTKIAALGTGNSYGLLRRSPVSGNIWTIDTTDYTTAGYVNSLLFSEESGRLIISDSDFTTMLSEV